ncbi:TBC1 domain family member 14-like isoform X1 [Portunus trituberculatus]|nr:TBC1 domain family member 14-like isoform X1 [Portunus trituberculatus]
MDDITESDHQPRESTVDKSDPADGHLKDSCTSRCGLAKVTLRIPFKPETFKAQSLLARFHSSRKSDSGIKSEFKAGSGGGGASGLGFGRGWRRPKTGNSFEGPASVVTEPENTSTSLPDDLNQNSTVVTNEGGAVVCDNGVSSASDELDTGITRSFSQEVSGGQGEAEGLFGTWPGRPRKLKILRKRLLASGAGSRINPDHVPAAKTSENAENKETSSLLPPTMDTQTLDDPAAFRKTKADLEDGTALVMNSKSAEVPSHNVSLDALLESLPLIYNPATKQLCLGTLKKNNEPSVNGMSGKTTADDYDHDIHPEKLKLACSENGTELGKENEKSQEEGFPSNSELGEALTLPKSLEIIQEVEESGETVKLIDKGSSPPSGNVSGSSSLERGNYETIKNTLQRVGTSNSLSITDASSFSSLSSLNTEFSAYSASDSAVCLGSHQSDTGSLRDFVLTDNDGKSKKRGIADFLTRNLFSWRHKDGGGGSDGASSTSSSPVPSSPVVSTGWRIFSRPSTRLSRSPEVQVRNCDLEAGSVGLIMENRPNTLPAKTAGEQLKHKQEYQRMVSAAKKKELREAKERKKAQANLQRQEEQLAIAVATWNTEILPKWDTMRTHKKCRELWWQGLPSCVRGRVWELAIGNDLNITPQLYNIMVQRSVEKLVSLSECGSMASQEDMTSDSGDQEATIDLIRLDVSRTFPHLCIFQKGGPYHDPLHNILGAYACYRPDVGYVQGMSFLAATLLLNMNEENAFISFSNLLNRPAHMAFFRVNQPMMCAYYQTFEALLAANLPSLATHLQNIRVTPDLYVLDWLLTVFSRPLPLDAAVRIWDVYLRDGEEFLLRAAIGILKLYEEVLTHQECTATAAQFLTRLPDDLCADALFRAIASVRTSAHKRTFAQILQEHMDAMSAADV